MRRSVYHAGNSRTVRYRDIEGQDDTPGRFEMPGSPRIHAHAQSANRLGKTTKWRRARRASRLDYLRDISISQRRGGVQWPWFDQNRHILDDGMGVLRCQLDFMIWIRHFDRHNDAREVSSVGALD